LDRSLKGKARELRKELTEAEKHLWYQLRLKNLGFKFRRQAVIGKYIVDFICFEKRLIVEVDGGQHAENMDDKVRDNWLTDQGYRVLRFWNNEVLTNRDGVLDKIIQTLNHPLPNPPLKGEGIVRRRNFMDFPPRPIVNMVVGSLILSFIFYFGEAHSFDQIPVQPTPRPVTLVTTTTGTGMLLLTSGTGMAFVVGK